MYKYIYMWNCEVSLSSAFQVVSPCAQLGKQARQNDLFHAAWLKKRKEKKRNKNNIQCAIFYSKMRVYLDWFVYQLRLKKSNYFKNISLINYFCQMH
jgi:hypothetical protein